VDVWFCVLPWWISVLLVVPLVVDGGTQTLGWRQSNNSLRLVTGMVAGVGEMMFLVFALNIAFQLGSIAGTALVR
jgi:uncharacterized membrane protein